MTNRRPRRPDRAARLFRVNAGGGDASGRLDAAAPREGGREDRPNGQGFPVPADRRNLHGTASLSFAPPRPPRARLPTPVGSSPAGQPGKLSQVSGVLSLIGSKFKRNLIACPYISRC